MKKGSIKPGSVVGLPAAPAETGLEVDKYAEAGVLLSLGYNINDVAERLSVNPQTVKKWVITGKTAVDPQMIHNTREFFKQSYTLGASEFAAAALHKLTEEVNSDQLHGKDLAIVLGIVIDKMNAINQVGAGGSVSGVQVNVSFENLMSLPDEPDAIDVD